MDKVTASDSECDVLSSGDELDNDDDLWELEGNEGVGNDGDEDGGNDDNDGDGVDDDRDLKIDGAVLICMHKKSFLKCGNCNNRLKLILLTCEQFCLAKQCPICYKIDFQNTSHVVAFIAVAQGTL